MSWTTETEHEYHRCHGRLCEIGNLPATHCGDGKFDHNESRVEMKLNIDIADVTDDCEMEHRGRVVMVVMLTLFLNGYGVIAIPEIRCRLDLANAWKMGCIQPHISTMATVDDLVTKGVRLSVIGSFPRSIMC